MKPLQTSALSVLMALSLATAGESSDPNTGAKPEAEEKVEPPVVKKADPKLQARIKELIEQLGHEEYETREGASKALITIGRPALKQLEAARKDKDAERATRAGEACSKIRELLPDPDKVDRDCTNGWMAAYDKVKQVQTFTVEEDVAISKLRFRAARGYNMPGDLGVKLELVGAKKEKPADPLATAKQAAACAKGVTRYMQWFELELKAKLEKGKTYRLVFSSADSAKTNPWLINCMYRDHFKAGSHMRQDGEKTKKLGAYDLVLQLCAKDAVKLTTVPAKLNFTARELFGLGHDGANMGSKATNTIEQIRGGVL